eukprot:1652539-Pleurochrysis_carterae.AAC.1
MIVRRPAGAGLAPPFSLTVVYCLWARVVRGRASGVRPLVHVLSRATVPASRSYACRSVARARMRCVGRARASRPSVGYVRPWAGRCASGGSR